MNKRSNRSVEDQLRQVIHRSGMAQNQICKAAKMDEGTLSCFMLGKQESMRLKTAQRLARVLGLRLVLEEDVRSNGRSSGRKKATKSMAASRQR